MSKFIKVSYSLPESLVKKIRVETAWRAKELGMTRGVQTPVVRTALKIGLRELERRRKK